MKTRSFFVAATGQNVGKTTTCLGLVFGLLRRNGAIGYMKPVGQEHVEIDDVHVDKDVLLFRSHFKLTDPYHEMSPVLLPRGFTRDFLDEKVSHEEMLIKILRSHKAIASRYPITVVEGTGHTGVGSIVNLNNAQVAAYLKVPIILVASGGLGSSYDDLELNRLQCEKYGVPIAGIILNRVLDEKREMIIHYMTKALKRWNVPLLGAVPYDPFLSSPTMNDFELLFQTKVLSGEQFRYRHFDNISLIDNPEEISENALMITSAEGGVIPSGKGIILTGRTPPSEKMIEKLKKADIPALYSPVSSFIALKMIHSYTTKTRSEDTSKIEEAVTVVSRHIDFDLLENAVDSCK